MIRLMILAVAGIALSGCFWDDNADTPQNTTTPPAVATPLDTLTPGADVAALDTPPAGDVLPADLQPPQ
ncbi:MAG: hypothetical protein Q7T36_00090 [Fluviicoccus sp.]|uniref:hypothetical protein n=1 Tax=Fluviicoccus sp. TaxID=2003552 RepID=UPI00271DA790|nr:hypothetical protein [Fluviicoccus sp.]MDO8328856.1 hypothetical protein [Fluviicoccus sp.]